MSNKVAHIAKLKFALRLCSFVGMKSLIFGTSIFVFTVTSNKPTA